MVDPEQRWDGGRPDVEDPGVSYFAVNLHHHLILLVPYDAVCNRKGSKRLLVFNVSINASTNKLVVNELYKSTGLSPVDLYIAATALINSRHKYHTANLHSSSLLLAVFCHTCRKT